MPIVEDHLLTTGIAFSLASLRSLVSSLRELHSSSIVHRTSICIKIALNLIFARTTDLIFDQYSFIFAELTKCKFGILTTIHFYSVLALSSPHSYNAFVFLFSQIFVFHPVFARCDLLRQDRKYDKIDNCKHYSSD